MYSIYLLLLLLIYRALAYPSAPGTCNLNKMAIVGHGPSQSDCPDCYGVAIATSKDSSLVDFKITGRYGYQGLLLLVKDVETNKTVGEFQKFDDERFTSVACDDDEDEADQIDPDSYAVLGHIDPKIKEWPVDVSWGLESVPKNIKLKLQGMVVLDYDNFHIIPEFHFTVKKKEMPAETTTTTTTTTSSIASSTTATTTEDDEEEQVAPPITLTSTPNSSSTWIEVEHDEGTIVEQETNQLFLWVLSVVISMYALLSLCFRKVFKSRRQTQYVNLNNTELSVLTSSN